MKKKSSARLKNLIKIILLIFVPVLILVTVIFGKAIAKDNSLLLPTYTPLDENKSIHGTLSSAGSVSISPILEAWAEEFKKMYPFIDFKIEGKNSESALEALREGTSLFGAMSRPINNREIAAFKKKKLYAPTEIKVSLDALGVIVHPSNPITTISQLQLDAIYSSSRSCGSSTGIKNWKALDWDISQEIKIYLANPDSGISDFFRKNVLCDGEYKKGEYPTIMQDSNPTIVQDSNMVEFISKNKYSLGFSSMAVINNSVKTLAVGKSKQHPSFPPNLINITNKEYPITRHFYLYIDKRPETPLPDYMSEFIKFIFSRQGQKIAASKGVFPLSPNVIGEQLNELLF